MLQICDLGVTIQNRLLYRAGNGFVVMVQMVGMVIMKAACGGDRASQGVKPARNKIAKGTSCPHGLDQRTRPSGQAAISHHLVDQRFWLSCEHRHAFIKCRLKVNFTGHRAPGNADDLFPDSSRYGQLIK